MTGQPQPDPQRQPATAPRPARLAYGPAALVLCVWLAVAVLVLRFPVQPGALGMALLAAGALVVWRPLLLWALARRHRAAGLDVLSAFGHGTVVGLLGTVLFIIGERSAFTELFDVSHAYRVAGPFSVMNLGGAYVEGYLVSALPFLLMRLLPPLPRWRLVGNGLLLLGTVYAVMVTFSRSGYAAFLIGLGVVLLWLLAWGAGRREGLALRRGPGRAAALVLAAVVCAVAWPVWMGAYAQSRFAAVDRDLVTRETHWAECVSMKTRLSDQVFGQWLAPMKLVVAPARDHS